MPDFALVQVPGRQRAADDPIVTHLGGDSPIVTALAAAFGEAVVHEPRLRTIVDGLRAAGLTFGVLGGWVRDSLLAATAGAPPRPSHDIDLVVLDTTHATLETLLPSPTTRTLFGGFTYSGHGLGIDLWGANDTYLTRRLGLPSDLAHVVSVTDFNINAIVFVPSQASSDPWLLDAGALASLRNRTISFHFEFIALPVAQVARLLNFATRLRFSLDTPTTDFIRWHCQSATARAEVLKNLGARNSLKDVELATRLLDQLLVAGSAVQK